MQDIDRFRAGLDISLYDDEAFADIPRVMKSTFNLSGTWFMQGDLQAGRFQTLLRSFPVELERLYWDQYADNNVYTNAQIRFGRPNAPLNLDRHVDQSKLLASRYYNELLLPVGIRYCMGLSLQGGPSGWVIGWHRSRSQEAFSPQDEELLTAIVPDLRRLAAVRTRLAGALQAQRDMEDVLDMLPQAILSVSMTGRVLSANRAARALLAARDGLVRMGDGQLAPSAAGIRGMFGRMLAACCQRLPGCGHRLRLERPSGHPPLLADLLPSPKAGSGECVLVVADPIAEPRDVSGKLRDFFGLTGAEARLAGQLAAGKRLLEIAGEQGVSINTIKTQLRAIMTKMDTSRQSDIIRIIERMP